MSGKMPTPRIVTFTPATGRALVECGEYTAWMTADDTRTIAIAWYLLALELEGRRLAVEAVSES